MIMSNDIENRSLALEMISNCNISKSYDVVSGLYFWNWDWLNLLITGILLMLKLLEKE
jgi:hypothetical protein